MFPPLLAAATAVGSWPMVVLAVSVALVIVGISILRLHPFIALIFAAIVAGVMAEALPVNPNAKPGDADYGKVIDSVASGKLSHAMKLTALGFGETAATIAIVIGMATVIGMGLMESGAADKVVRRFLAVCGQGPAGISFALVMSTYVLSIPIFFDSMFMLMVPIAMAMALRTGRDFTLYVLSICAGGVLTHSLTVPHPGPLFMVENLHVDIGLSIWVGMVVGIIPVLVGWLLVRWLNRVTPVPLRESPNAPLSDLRTLMDRPESELPGLMASLAPVVLPILLISCSSVFEVIKQTYAKQPQGWALTWINLFGGMTQFLTVKGYVDFIGHKSTALIIGGALAIWLVRKQKGASLAKIESLMGPALETAGVMILITAAGGAFGSMLRYVGVAAVLEQWAANHQGVNLIWLGYGISLAFRIAQGSATVAMQTASAIVGPLVISMEGTGVHLPYHPMYLFLSIGFGAMGVSWMNDSGFWVVSRLSGFTERETLRTWTVLLFILSLAGAVFTWLLSTVLPLAG